MSFIKANWEVDVTVTDFSGWLFDTVDLMQRSDVLLGMHGAGMTNVYFLPEVCNCGGGRPEVLVNRCFQPLVHSTLVITSVHKFRVCWFFYRMHPWCKCCPMAGT